MAFVRAIKQGDTYIPEPSIGQESESNANVFNKNKETTLGAIGRNLYKPVRETISTLGGAPGDIWNLLAGIVNPIRKKLDFTGDLRKKLGLESNISKMTSRDVPSAPEFLTSKGMRENIAVPLGEAIFGEGSQEEQPGFIEGMTEKAAKWAPYTLGGAGISLAKGTGLIKALQGLTGGFATNLVQGTVGQGLKEAGLGELPQYIGEAVIGSGLPIAGKLLRGPTKSVVKGISKNLTKTEKTLISKAEQALDAGDMESARKIFSSAKKVGLEGDAFKRSDAYKKFFDKTKKVSGKNIADLGVKILKKVTPYGFGIASYVFKNPLLMLGLPGVRMSKNMVNIFQNPQLRKEGIKVLKNVAGKTGISSGAEYLKRKPKGKEPVKYVRYTPKT